MKTSFFVIEFEDWPGLDSNQIFMICLYNISSYSNIFKVSDQYIYETLPYIVNMHNDQKGFPNICVMQPCRR